MSGWFFILAQIATIAYALVGGVFLAFSDFIMRSFSHASGVGGVEAMQIINREVFRWIFMALFLGLAPVSLGMTVYGLMVVGGSTGALMAFAGLLYFIGCFVVTILFNVPMNETLADMDISQPATLEYWTRTYLPRWTFWNTIRAASCTVAAAVTLFGLLWSGA